MKKEELIQELYMTPESEVIEIKSAQVLCGSQQNAGNNGYDSDNYEW